MSGLKTLFSGPKLTPQAVVRLPDREDPAALEAQRKKRAELSAGKGRASTNLTDFAGNQLGK